MSDLVKEIEKLPHTQVYIGGEFNISIPQIVDKINEIIEVLNENIWQAPYIIKDTVCNSVQISAISLLDHFAGLAMQSLMQLYITTPHDPEAAEIAQDAYRFANAMLEERKKYLEFKLGAEE